MIEGRKRGKNKSSACPAKGHLKSTYVLSLFLIVFAYFVFCVFLGVSHQGELKKKHNKKSVGKNPKESRHIFLAGVVF
jgi:hypothetical protein